MTLFQIIVIVWTIQIGGHHTDVASAILPVITFAQFNTRDFGDGVRFIRLFQRPGEKILLLNRLGTITRINAAGAEKADALHVCQVRSMNEIGLDYQVLIYELRTRDVIGLYAPYFGCGNKDVVGFLLLEKGVDADLIQQIQLGACRQYQFLITPGAYATYDGGAHHSAVASDVDFGVLRDCCSHGLLVIIVRGISVALYQLITLRRYH